MSLARRTGLVFLCTCAYLGWLAASRFVLFMNDEGIYLDGGLRVLHGEMPYKDFFSITGPGTYALLAASFRVFGTTMLAARIPVVWDIAIITACLFWLVSKLSDSTTAGFTAFVYLTFATFVDTAVVANHRWDSSAWAILAGTLIIHAAENVAAETPSAGRPAVISFVAGISVGIAAWCTPPVALAAAALGVCLAAYRATRRLLAAYLGGAAVSFAAGVLWLTSTKALRAMLDSFLWAASNYPAANRTSYGAVPGGYPNLLHSPSPGDAVLTIALLVFRHPAGNAPVLQRNLALETPFDDCRHSAGVRIGVDALHVSPMGPQSLDVGLGAVLRFGGGIDRPRVIWKGRDAPKGSIPDCAVRRGFLPGRFRLPASPGANPDHQLGKDPWPPRGSGSPGDDTSAGCAFRHLIRVSLPAVALLCHRGA